MLDTDSLEVQHKLSSCGIPLEFIADHVNANTDLPDGAYAHINSATSDAIRAKLTKLLTKYKALFPSELPFAVPPERGLDDKLYIHLKPNVVMPHRRVYKTSPAEQILIRDQLELLTDSG